MDVFAAVRFQVLTDFDNVRTLTNKGSSNKVYALFATKDQVLFVFFSQCWQSNGNARQVHTFVFAQVTVGHDLVAGAVQLQVVVIHENDQVVQTVLVSGVGSLPDLALLGLAVAHHAEDLVVLVVQLTGQGHTGGAGQTLTQGAGGDVDAGAAVHRGVTLKHGALLAQGVQHGLGEETHGSQAGILDGADMALGEHHAVPVLPAGVLGVQVHVFEVAGGDKICRRQGSAGMTGLGLVDHVDDLHTHLRGGVFQLLHGDIFHKNHLIENFRNVRICLMSDK